MEKSKRKQFRDFVISAMIIGAIPLLWIIGDFYQTIKNSLPKDVQDLPTFIDRMPAPKEVHVFEKDNAQFIEVIAHRAAFPATPSGHAVYVFDHKGRIVFWTIDSGDSISYWEDWGDRRSNLKSTTVQDALEIIAENN